MRLLANQQKGEDEFDEDIEKQQKVIQKDWTGERNTKIMDVKKKLVDIMAVKLNKPLQVQMHCQTDAKYIEPFDFERLQILNTEYHKQLALNGQVFSQKEKQID